MRFFFNDTATTEIYTLSLHDALPICTTTWKRPASRGEAPPKIAPTNAPGSVTRPVVLVWSVDGIRAECTDSRAWVRDRKSTRLNSSHANISYAVFCLTQTQCHLPL